jgi:hypothetical protein
MARHSSGVRRKLSDALQAIAEPGYRLYGIISDLG